MQKKITLVLAGAVLLAGVLPAAAQETLVISTWAFNADKLKANIYEPFEKANNVKIVVETGNNSDRLNKVRLREGSTVDLIYLADAFAMQGIEEGLFEVIDRSNLPNVANLYGLAQAPHGQDYGPAYTVGRFGIIFDSAAVSTPLNSWSDLWRDDLAGNISVPGITTTAGPMLVLAAGDKAGMAGDAEAAFKELAGLKPNLVKTYNRSSELVNLFAQGEIIVGAAQDFAFGRIQDAVPTAVWVNPVEGAYANLNTINIVKGSKNKALAEKYINFVLSADVQKALALARVDSPVNTDVALSDDEAAGLTYGADLIGSLQTVDWAAV
ncbi:MAG: ABC transporter substrate-binding protein, partial [Alphaproteobacteria bacterium]